MRLKQNAVLFGVEFYSSCFRFLRKAPQKILHANFASDASADRR